MSEQTGQNSNLPPKPPVKMSGKKTPPPSNVIFVGKETRKNDRTGKNETVLREAPARIVDGETIIKLPPSDEQQKGFYHEKAAQIIALFPDDYKIPVTKG